MLTRLCLQGYRAVGSACLEPGWLTVLVGPNSSGKTSFFEALGLIRNLTLPSFKEVRRGYSKVKIEAWFRLENLSPDLQLLVESLKGYINTKEVRELVVTLSVDKKDLGPERTPTNIVGVDVSVSEKGRNIIKIEIFGGFQQLSILNVVNDLFKKLVLYVPSWRLYEDLLSVKSYMGRLLYINYPRPQVYERIVRWIGGVGRYVDMRVLPEDNNLVVEVFDGLSGTWVDIRLAAGGLQRALPLLLALAVADEGSIVVVDDAELGLHPAAQLKLAEAIVETVERGVQVILSTHSPALLTALTILSGEKRIDGKLVVACRDQRDVKLHHAPLSLKGELPKDIGVCLEEMGAVGIFGEEAKLILEHVSHVRR